MEMSYKPQLRVHFMSVSRRRRNRIDFNVRIKGGESKPRG